MNIKTCARAGLLAGVGSLALAIQPAAAAETHDGAAAADAADNAAADVSTNAGLNDIIVTATKRETNLQQTPISINVMDTQSLADRHVLSLFNLADGSIPSLRVATFEARQSALTIGIRGIVPYDQNQTARDNGVTVYLDGVALGRTQGLNAALFDVERIEVLKGPQGTLFGRNTEGGAVNIVTKAPTGEFGGRVTAGVGNYGSRNGELHLDLPSFANIAIKIDGVYQHQDPTVKDPLEGSTGWNFYDRVGGRVQARWKPFEGFTADFSYDQARDENTPQYSQLINFNPRGYNVGTFVQTAPGTAPVLRFNGANCNTNNGTTNICIAPKAPLVGVHPERQSVADVGVPQQPSVDKTHGFMANLKYDVAPHLELRSITAWRGVTTDQWDNSGGPERVPFSPSFAGENLATSNSGKFSRYSLSFLTHHQFSQELQAVGSVPQLEYVFGAYYYTEHVTEYAATPSSNLWNADGTAYTILTPNPVPALGPLASTNQGWQPGSQFVTRNSFAYDHNYSVYGQATFTPEGFSALHITAGGRWTKDKRHGTLFVVNNKATNFTFTNDISRFDPMVNIAFDASPDVHLYAKYATGFRAGGADDRSQRFDAFGPESVKSYEVGAKMDFFDHKARLNLAGYIMDRKNTQFDFDVYDTDPSSPTFNAHLEEAINAPGTTKIRGIEADLTVRPIPELTLSGSYAYTYWKVPPAPNPLNGNILQSVNIVYTPKNAASGAIDYALPIGSNGATFQLHLDGNYSSSYYSFEAENTRADASFVVNGRIAVADIPMNDHGDRVTLSVWCRNLFDEQHIYRRSDANSSPTFNYSATGTLLSTSYSGILGDYANFNPPRTFGVEGTVHF